MKHDNTEQVIKENAVNLFSQNGYYGTTIREIAKASECSLPMVYYYYTNKEKLFESIVYDEFLALIERLNNAIPQGLSIEDLYLTAIKQRKELSDYDKAVYKLFMKVYLGFEGDLPIRKKLIEWEKKRMDRNKKILSKLCTEEKQLDAFTNVMIRVLENMIEKIIVIQEDIPDEQIKQELSFIINANI